MRSVAVVTALAEEDEPHYPDVDIVEENSGALPVAEEVAEPQTDELPLEFASAETEPEPSVADLRWPRRTPRLRDGTADE